MSDWGGAPGGVPGTSRGGLSVTGGAGRLDCAGAPGWRILIPMAVDCPPTTVTLSSVNPRFGCQARIRYLPGGMSAMLKEPFAAVFVE